MVSNDHDEVQTAAEYADKAVAVAGNLKPGTYEAVQALALVSIAHSLAVLAQTSRSGPTAS